MENVHVENITAKSTKYSVLGIETDVLYRWRNLVSPYEGKLTSIRGIHVRNVTVQETGTPFRILGDAQRPVKDVFLENITIGKIHGQPKRYENAENIHATNVRLSAVADDGKTRE